MILSLAFGDGTGTHHNLYINLYIAARHGAIPVWRNIVQQSQAARASGFRQWPLGMVAVLLVILLALGFSTQSPIEGHTAPAFELTTFEGERLALAELRGKIVVLNFWASWCAPCREEAPALENVWQQYCEKGVVFVGINVKDLEQNAHAFIARYGIAYPNGPDRYGKISAAYRVRAFPETFLIAPDGLVAKRLVGAITETQLQTEIEALRIQPEASSQ